MLKYLHDLLAERGGQVSVIVKTPARWSNGDFELLGADSTGVVMRATATGAVHIYPWQGIEAMILGAENRASGS